MTKDQIDSLLKSLENEQKALIKNLEDIQEQIHNNYKNYVRINFFLILILGYILYFTTSFDVLDFFPKVFIHISFFLMVVSLVVGLLVINKK